MGKVVYINYSLVLHASENDCTYNDVYGLQYVGGKAVTEDGYECQAWAGQTAYEDDSLPDGSREAAVNRRKRNYMELVKSA